MRLKVSTLNFVFILGVLASAWPCRAETYSRSVQLAPIVFSNNFRVTGPLANGANDPQAASSPQKGYISRAIVVHLTNISPIAQEVKITSILSNLSWSSNGNYPAVTFGGVAVTNPQNSAQAATSQTVSLGPASTNSTIPCSGCSKFANFYLFAYGPVSTVVTDGVYFSGALRFIVEVQEARGAVIGTVRTVTNCIAGCFETTGGSTTYQNLVSTMNVESQTTDSLNGGRPF